MIYRELERYPKRSTVPRGLPRLYFCAHRDDYSCFYEICNEILEICNCTVWYDSDSGNEISYEEYWFNLRQMHLVVIPVTRKLLSDPSPLITAVYSMALTQHIPILPIVTEDGLDADYAKFFGNLQYLTPNSTDGTALPYREKLASFLDTVLLHDELIVQIRSHFDACIFMSYRKVDRIHAQDMMRLIHSHRFCRDVAIWYDEFLTPGEDFTESIRSALKQCSLFALTVTPNLLQDGNYVMEYEYPMAKREGKPIIAIEMLPTDRNELEEKYKKIPSPLDTADSKRLASALIDALSLYICDENDEDPEHMYYIGLAYLNGIDVETDHGRALFLIENAAAAGFPDAVKRLAAMYKNGSGVERNIEKGLAYQKQYSELALQIYLQEKSYAAAKAYLLSLTGLTTYVNHVSIEEKRAILEAEYNGSARLMNDFPDDHLFIAAHIHASVSLGCDVYAAARDFLTAEEYCLHAITEYRERIEASPKIDRIFRKVILSDCYTKYANVLKQQRKYKEAADYTYEAICLYKKHADDEKFASDTEELLLKCYEQLAELYAKDETAPRKTNPLLSLEELCAAVKNEGAATVKRKRFLINCYNALANAYDAEGNAEKADAYFQYSCDAAFALLQSEASVLSAEFVLMECWAYGHFLLEQKRYAEAIEMFKQALDSELLFKNTQSAVKTAIVSCYCEWGDALCKLSNYNGALAQVGIALDYIETCKTTLTESECETLTVAVYKLLYKVNIELGDVVEIEECLSFLRPFLEAELPEGEEGRSRRIQYKMMHAKMCLKRAVIHRKEGRHEDAYAYSLKSMTLITEVNKEYGVSVDRLYPAVQAMHELAKSALQLQDMRTALSGFMNAVTLMENLKRQTADSASKDERADMLRRLINLCEEVGQFFSAIEEQEYAKNYYRKLAQYTVELFGATSLPDDQLVLVRAHIAAAKFDTERKNAYLAIASAMINDLCKKHPENAEYAALRRLFPT